MFINEEIIKNVFFFFSGVIWSIDNLFGWSNGSTDEVKLNINGREWMKLFRFNKQIKLYVFSCVCNFFQSSTSYLLNIAQGELTTVLVNEYFDTAEDFLESINKVSMKIMITILIYFFCKQCYRIF